MIEGGDDDLLAAITAAEDEWRVQRALEGLGRLLPKPRPRPIPDQGAVDAYLRDEYYGRIIRRRGNWPRRGP